MKVCENKMIKVASIQYWFSDDNTKEERIRHIENLIDQAAEADLILLPEVWNIGWRSFDKYREGSETIEGETISRIGKKANEINAYILAGTIIEKSGKDLYNTAVFLNPKGEVISKYRKIHLVTRKGSEEVMAIKTGREIVTVKTELGVFGFGVCYDLRFPELYRKMAINKGVEVFLQPAAWPLVRVENWIDLSHARANENQCYLISCNCAGFNRGVQYLGHSSIVDPHGISIASAGLFQKIVKGELDMDNLRKFRKETPHLKSRVLPV